jgi:ribosomal protein S25
MSRTQTRDWSSKFRSRQTSADNAKRSECPLTSKADENVAHIKKNIHENRHITTHKLDNKFGISFDSCHKA